MKKIIILLLTLSTVFTAKAQLHQVGMHFNSGFSFTKFQFDEDVVNNFAPVNFSYQTGVFGFLNLERSGAFVFNPSLNYTRVTLKSEEISFGDDWQSYDITTRNQLSYLTFKAPVGINLLTGMSDKNILFIGVGPYFSHLLQGNQKVSDESNPQNNKTTPLKLGNGKDDHLIKSDAGITLGFSINAGPVYLGAFTDIGLKDISPRENVVMKNRNFYVNLGIVLFNKD